MKKILPAFFTLWLIAFVFAFAVVVPIGFISYKQQSILSKIQIVENNDKYDITCETLNGDLDVYQNATYQTRLSTDYSYIIHQVIESHEFTEIWKMDGCVMVKR